jgi:hypothetical protein
MGRVDVLGFDLLSQPGEAKASIDQGASDTVARPKRQK